MGTNLSLQSLSQSGLSPDSIAELTARFEQQLAQACRKDDLELLKRDWASKDGLVKELFKGLRDLPADEKPTVAALLNELRSRVEQGLELKRLAFGKRRLKPTRTGVHRPIVAGGCNRAWFYSSDHFS